jgi:hypothetical protein
MSNKNQCYGRRNIAVFGYKLNSSALKLMGTIEVFTGGGDHAGRD